MGWAFNGTPPMENDGAILMAFSGEPDAIAEPWPMTPQEARPILQAFRAHWPAISGSGGLMVVIAKRTNAIVSRVCPAAANAREGGLSDVAVGYAADEWRQTLTWLRSFIGGDDGRCWRGDALTTIKTLRDDFAKSDGLDAFEHDLNAQIKKDGAQPTVAPWIVRVAGLGLFWTGVLVVFPYSRRARAIYLFNKKLRGALSLFVLLPAIMTLFPPLRRHMLLPFREHLLADAHLELLKEAEFYPGLHVRDREDRIQDISTAIPDVREKRLLIGESGLGKSTYLRVLAAGSRRTIAYLNASNCSKGVEAAIVERTSGFESEDFFRGLVYSGDLAVIIDGLNEVSSDTRAQIIRFANRSGRADIIIATQPIEGVWGDQSPLTLTTPFELLPLARDDIIKFLKSRPARDSSSSSVSGDDYDRAVDKLVTDALDQSPASDAEMAAEQVLHERRAAELILSNPMDLTYASELIAIGQKPRPSQLIEQAFRLACARFRKVYDRDFPTLDFARKAVSLRKEDRNWLDADDFADEQGVLAEFRLLVPRLKVETSETQITVMRFRHEKVMDVLTKQAFEIDQELQVELIDDPRFRGVYLLFAQAADRKQAQQIRDLLVRHAANSHDHGLSDEFVLLFDRGPIESTHSNI